MIYKLLLGAVLGLFISITTTANESPIRLGWQVPWATQGQLVMALKYTNISKLTDTHIEYSGFSYGGPLNKAALGNNVDILLTADQPAMVLVSRNPNFRIVSRMMYNRVCIYVPPASPLNSLADISGKTIMGPIGAAAERVALTALKKADVDITKLRIGQLDMAQQSALLIRNNNNKSWPEIDALFGFDPLPAVFDAQEKARMIHCGKVVSVVVAHKDMIDKRRDELTQFLKAFKMSWHYFTKNPETLNRLFSRDSKLEVSNEILDNAASIEPNRWVERYEDLHFGFTNSDYETFEQSNQFLLNKKIITQPVDMQKFIDLSIVSSAESEPSKELLDAIIVDDAQ
jgi:ABC-type nitrate/sulfonate/bicarbonate transport system substrate-binding protein